MTKGKRVSPEVRARVLDAADALGYRVNALARGLQGQQSNLVGVVASRLDTPFRALQVRTLAQKLLREGMNPLLLVADAGEDIRALIQNILAYRLAGVIVTSDTPSPDVIEACNRAGVPVVMINRGPAATGTDTVCMDLGAGGRAAFEMLSGGGVRRFGLLAPAQETYSVTGRTRAFVACCEEAGHTVLRLASDGQSHASGKAACAALQAEITAGRIDGLFCATDLLALGVLDGLRHDRGVDIPGTLQVVGFDDIEQASWSAYALSTVRQDIADQAGAAVELAMKRLADPERPFETRTFGLHKVFRGTTRGHAGQSNAQKGPSGEQRR
ncbi:MAG: LacI family transcriptional regulator [Rhodobacteraceae bacterium HLUCCA08]|nr:MAG: LacI family transcriptional regulator [Rhodobacteraceae bacterium HLUCCA08]